MTPATEQQRERSAGPAPSNGSAASHPTAPAAARPAARGRDLLAALALVLGAALGPAPELAAARQPNIVVLLADDLGHADVGFRGGEIATPSIDRIAKEGVVLERYYVAPICSPTRAALLTGRDPIKLGIAYDQINPWNNVGLAPRETTLAEILKADGYQTALVGKWHLGHTQQHQLPNAQGFDHFYGHLHTNTDYYEHTPRERSRPPAERQIRHREGRVPDPPRGPGSGPLHPRARPLPPVLPLRPVHGAPQPDAGAEGDDREVRVAAPDRRPPDLRRDGGRDGSGDRPDPRGPRRGGDRRGDDRLLLERQTAGAKASAASTRRCAASRGRRSKAASASGRRSAGPIASRPAARSPP
jgi:hypothetical protein